MFPDILKVNAAHKKGRLSGHSNRQRQKDRELKNIDIKAFLISYFASYTCWLQVSL
jgi:hypothetical protein